MQIYKFTDYTFRALIYLARNRNETATVDKLAVLWYSEVVTGEPNGI